MLLLLGSNIKNDSDLWYLLVLIVIAFVNLWAALVISIIIFILLNEQQSKR